MKPRVLLAILLPFAVCALQWWLWDYLKPFVWFLFFPTAYFSAWLGGVAGGLAATLISALLVWYVFIPSQFSWSLENPATAFSIFVFLLMGLLFTLFFKRLEEAKQRANSKMLLSENRFYRLFQEAPVPLVYLTHEGALLDLNKRFEQTFGYSLADIPTIAEWWPRAYPDPTYRQLVTDIWGNAVEEAMESGSDIEPIEYRVTCKDGRERIAIISGIVLDGSILATLFDITERRQAEDAVLASKAELEAALSSMTDAVFISDIAGNFVEFNDAFATFHRFRNKEECARTFAEYPGLFEVYFPDGQPAPVEQWAVPKALRGEASSNIEYSLHRKDTGESWVGSYSYAPIRDEDGVIVGAVVVCRDITGQKQAAEEIRQLNANLERRVAERTAELTAANRELDSFAYAVSHDLRAPLRAMNGFSQALRQDCGKQLSDEGRAYLDQIEIASNKMTELIDAILALSRSTRGEMQFDPIDLSAMSTRLLKELADSEPARHVDWQVEENLNTEGDVRMVEAAMRNLLGNAWKYTGRTAAPAIRVYARELAGRPGFCVSDNGAGFDMSLASRLFQPFRRMHREDEFPGIGIGLATVQRIVHRHGGEIRAEASPGRGATFWFTLNGDRPQETP